MQFELQPNLIGELIELRPLGHNDFEALYKAAADPLIWEQHPQSNRYQRNIFQKFFDGGLQSGGALKVVDRENSQIIGSSRYYGLTAEHVIVGYTFLARKYWGGTYNQELKAMMLRHAFRFVDKVLFEIGETNFRSRRAMEKIGGQLIEMRTLDERSHCIYGIKKSDFKI